MFQRFAQLAFTLSFASSAFGAAVPGGLIRTAESFSVNTYELVLSPAYTISPSGAYLSSEIRYQPTEDLGAGFGFGAGEVGFNFGAYGVWHILPDLSAQPAFSLSGGLYFNRVDLSNYFVVKVTPTVSKTVRASWGKVTPYVGLPMAPSFRLGQADNSFSIKTSVGSEFTFQAWRGVRLWAEMGIGIVNSVHEFSLGFAYPFSAFEG